MNDDVPQAPALDFQCRLARAEDFAVIERLLELYQHDLSEIWDQSPDADGRYGYDLSRHREARRFFAYLLLVDGRPAGCALVAPAVVTQHTGCWMEQFFVLRRLRRRGLGRRFALQVLRSHPGPWEVGQMMENTAAQAFWRAVVAHATAGRFVEQRVESGWWQGVVQRFHLPPAGDAGSSAAADQQGGPAEAVLPPLPTIAPGRYRHYKGGEYQVLGVVRHSETLEPLVLYRPLRADVGDWVRPHALFIESVEVDGRRQPRFQALDDHSVP